jgi:hypothetical protein
MARIGTNDGQGWQNAGDDAERRDGRPHAERGDESAQPVCVPSFGMGRPETLDGTQSVPTTLHGNEESMGIYGNLCGNPGETAVAAAGRHDFWRGCVREDWWRVAAAQTEDKTKPEERVEGEARDRCRRGLP